MDDLRKGLLTGDLFDEDEFLYYEIALSLEQYRNTVVDELKHKKLQLPILMRINQNRCCVKNVVFSSRSYNTILITANVGKRLDVDLKLY